MGLQARKFLKGPSVRCQNHKEAADLFIFAISTSIFTNLASWRVLNLTL